MSGWRCWSAWRQRPLPAVELIDMREEFRADGAGAAIFAAADGGDAGDAGPRRAGDHPAEPARVQLCGDVPELRGEDGVRELRDFADVSQAAATSRA